MVRLSIEKTEDRRYRVTMNKADKSTLLYLHDADIARMCTLFSDVGKPQAGDKYKASCASEVKDTMVLKVKSETKVKIKTKDKDFKISADFILSSIAALFDMMISGSSSCSALSASDGKVKVRR